jgi:hypothetical protein
MNSVFSQEGSELEVGEKGHFVSPLLFIGKRVWLKNK